jgi:hypothetical protein
LTDGDHDGLPRPPTHLKGQASKDSVISVEDNHRVGSAPHLHACSADIARPENRRIGPVGTVMRVANLDPHDPTEVIPDRDRDRL